MSEQSKTELTPEEQLQQKVEEEKAKRGTTDLAALLEVLPGAPDTKQKEAWKLKYGEIFVFGFSPTELFVFRPLDRQGHIINQLRQQQAQMKLQEARQQAQEQGLPEMTSEELATLIGDLEVEVVRSCVLWPVSYNFSAKAGTVSTLHEIILQYSNFVPPQLAGMLVAKL